MEQKSKTILDILLSTNRVVETEAAAFPSNFTNQQIEEKLRKEKLVTSEDITRAYGILLDLPIIHLQNHDIKPEVLHLIPKNLAGKYKVIVFEKEGKIPGGKIKMAFAMPANLKNNPPQIIADLKNQKGVTIDIYLTSLEDFESVLARYDSEKPVPVVNHVDQKPRSMTSSLKTVDLANYKIPYDVISKFPIEISQKYNMVVFDNTSSSSIKVAVSNPTDPKVREILDFVREKNEIAIEEFVASPGEINEAIKLYYKRPPTIVPVNPTPPPPQPIQPAQPIKPIQPVQLAPKPEVHSQAPSPLPTPAPIIPLSPLNQDDRPLAPEPGSTKANAVYQANSSTILHPAQPMYSPKPQFNPKPVELPNQETPANTVGANPSSASEGQIQGRVVAPESDLDHFLGQTVKDIETLKQIAQTGNVPKILAAAVALAVEKKASDIHIEPEEKDLRIRFRVDGVLRDVIKMPVEIQPAIMSRVKILSRLKIDEQRVPQDGRFDVKTQGHEIDLRVSTLPTVRGEKVALRILDKTQNIYTLEQLGFLGRNLTVLEENIIKPFGVILATGPTGSGKSTTLYSILQKISTPLVNVITLEDPVEYEIPGINQCQVKPKIGFSFADGLRSVLRQDPNIIMVGEIRDSETASMATHAALTGHLVLSTLHTNDAAGALPRLINMGIEPFLITSSVNAIVAQRLVRKICPKCKKEAVIPGVFKAEIEKELAPLHLPQPYKFYEGTGCSECDHGYSGRMGIYEVLSMSDKIEELAIKKRPASEIAQAAIEAGMITLKQDGLLKATKGETSVSEVLRVTTNG